MSGDAGAGTKHPPLVLAFGDSLTAGYGLAPHQSLPARLEMLLRRHSPHARVVNAGSSGETTAEARRRLPRLLSALPAHPALVLVQFGANDFIRGLSAAAMLDNLDAMLGDLALCRLPVMLLGMRAPSGLPALLRGAAEAYEAVYPRLAACHDVPLYPDLLAGATGPGTTLADGAHPNAATVERVAAALLPHLLSALDAAQARAA